MSTFEYIQRPGIFQRKTLINPLITLVIVGLLGVSAYAAYEGIHDLILAEQSAQASKPAADAGVVASAIAAAGDASRYYILGAVVLLTIAMWTALEVGLMRGSIFKRALSICMYALLALWSIGFGYGFWWKTIASHSNSERNIENVAQLLQLQRVEAEQSTQTVQQLVASVGQKAGERQQEELTKGGSCGTPSPPGNGPLAKLRSQVTSDVAVVQTSIQQSWMAPLQLQLDALSKIAARLTDRAAIQQMTADDRQRLFRDVAAGTANAAARINSLNREQGSSTAQQLSEIAERLTVPPSRTACSDPDMARVLKSAAEKAASMQGVTAPPLQVHEGPDATAYAFKVLWDNVFWQGRKFVASVGAPIESDKAPAAFQDKDFIALVASIVVDIGLLVFTVIRPRGSFDRHSSENLRAKLQQALRAFLWEDDPAVQRLFDATMLRCGSHGYFVLPLAASVGSDEKLKAAVVGRNISVALEAVGAVDAAYTFYSPKVWLSRRIPWSHLRRAFRQASEQLARYGWTKSPPIPATPSSMASLAGPISEAIPIPPESLSLFRFRNSEFFDLLILTGEAAREDAEQKAQQVKRKTQEEQRSETIKLKFDERKARISERRKQRRESRSLVDWVLGRSPREIGGSETIGPGGSSPSVGGEPQTGQRLKWFSEWRAQRAAAAQKQAGQRETERKNLERQAEEMAVRQAQERKAVPEIPRSRNSRPAGHDVLSAPSDTGSEGVPAQQPPGLADSAIVAPERPIDNRTPPPKLAEGHGDHAPDSASHQRLTNGHAIDVTDVIESADTDLDRAARSLPPPEEMEPFYMKLDNMRRAVEMNAPFEEAHGTPEMTRKILDELTTGLNRAYNVVPTAHVDDMADPHVHDQIALEPSEKPKGTILKVHQQGYRQGELGRPLRLAQVVVSAGSSQNETTIN